MGEHHSPLRKDPAIERFNVMRERVHLNFRWTRRTTRTALVGFIIAPSIFFYLSSEYTNKFDWKQRKGQPLIPSREKAE